MERAARRAARGTRVERAARRGNAREKYAVCNGGRARCPHRAARVMRVRNGSHDGTAQRDTARGRDAKPRTAPGGAAARWGQRALPQRDTSGAQGDGPRNGARAWGVRRGGTSGAHGHGTAQRGMGGAKAMGPGNGARAWSAATGRGGRRGACEAGMMRQSLQGVCRSSPIFPGSACEFRSVAFDAAF